MSSAASDMGREKMLDRAMARYHYSGDALIEVLHTAQELYGFLSEPILKTIARRLKLPPSKVMGVATFYHLFRLAPPGEHSAVVCLGTACYAAGAQELMATLRGRRGEQWTVGSGRCMGSCGLAPVVICDGEAISRVSPEELEARIRKTDDGGNSKSDSPA